MLLWQSMQRWLKKLLQAGRKQKQKSIFFKKELEDALRLRLATEERVLHLDSALKECMHQLRFVQEQQEKRIDEAIMRTSREFDKERFNLEEKLADTNKRTSKLDHENSHLIKSLQIKDKLIEELRQQKFQVEADFNALVARMDSTEKLNSSLKYEVCVLEKELEIRNEDKEFNRRAADASHRQHLESMKKIAKLETECQRLRLLVRKRLPGPAALAKMRNEVESLGRDANETRRKKLNHVMGSLDDSYDKRISFLIERVSAIEEENKILKESLTKKNGELQSSRVISARAASKLSQLEAQLSDLGKNETNLELVSAIEPLSSVSTLVSMSEEDEFSCAESWASALMSELENFRNGKSKVQSCVSVGVSDLSLMDDFVEMEKLALVSVEEPVSRTRTSLDESNKTVLLLETDSKSYPSEATGKELVAITEQRKDPIENAPNWIQDILMIISQQSSVTQRSHEEIFEEVRVACKNHTVPGDVTNSSGDPACISGYLTWKNVHSSPTKNSYDGADSPNLSLVGISNQNINSNLNKAISKIVELIEGINNQQFLSKNDGNSTAYMVRVFQWKCSELSGVLHNFVHICYQLLQGKADIENFAEELSSTLNWIMNHCFSLQDVSSMKDSIKKHFSWDEPYSESEVELEEVKDIFPHTDESSELKLKAESRRLKDAIKSMELGRRVLEERLLTTTNKNESLMSKLHESEQSVANLEEELAFLKESKRLIEDQMENYKLLSEDLDTQLKVARVEMSKARQEFSSLEVELEDKSNCCEELEATCLELQLQLESASNKESSDYNVDQEEKQVRTDWEISAASEKLAECQETILNLGKQLKALASPRDAALIDKVITSTSPVKSNHRASLLDKMLAEDDDKADEEIKSPKTKEIICTSDPQKSRKASVGLLYGSTISMNDIGRDSKMLPGSFYSSNNTGYKMETRVGSLAIVPKRNKGAGAFLKKLLMRKKREGNKKAVLAITAK